MILLCRKLASICSNSIKAGLNRSLCIALVCVNPLAWAQVFELPNDGSRIVGHLKYHLVERGETLEQIAKAYDVGLLSLMAANKGIDPFLPNEKHVLTIPTKIILPDADQKGIVINLAELRLYYFNPKQQVVHIFPVSIGRIGRDTPTMLTHISQKRPNPKWVPPDSIRQEYLAKGVRLPKVVPAGPDNPLGDYALRLAYGTGKYLIHGSNKDATSGLRVSSGCIRMESDHIEWLFKHVERGDQVRIVNQPMKFSVEPDRSVFIEVHEPLTRRDGVKVELEVPKMLHSWLKENDLSDSKVRAVMVAQNGIPVEIISP